VDAGAGDIKLDFGGDLIMDFGANELAWTDVVFSAPPSTSVWGYIRVTTG